MHLALTSVRARDHGGHRAHKQIHDQLAKLHERRAVEHLGEHVGQVELGANLAALQGDHAKTSRKGTGNTPACGTRLLGQPLPY